VRLNDAIAQLGGDVYTDNQPFTLTFINAGWRRFQEMLVNYGVTWFKPEGVWGVSTNPLGPPVPPTTASDPGSQQYISWTNFFDGTAKQTAPVLPQNLIAPLVLWERPTGYGNFSPMDRMDNGLPGVSKFMLNRSWEWRNGAIYVPGATQSTDIRMRYAAFFEDFVAAATEAYANQPIPIVRALNPLAWFIAGEVARSRGDLDAGYFDQQAQLSTKYVYDIENLQGKSLGNEAELGKMTDRFTPTDGPQGPRGPQAGV
jgi:hypothetical protein